MTIHHSAFVNGTARQPEPTNAGEVCAVRCYFDVTDDVLEGDIIEIGVLPADQTLRDAILDSEQLDDGSPAAAVVDVGIMSGEVGADGDRTCGDELFDGSTVAQEGGVERMSKPEGFKIAPVGYHRGIGVKIVTDPASLVTAGGQIGITLFYGN